MKFTIQAKSFAAAMAPVGKVVERRNTYPILANVHITAGDGAVTLRGTDLDIEVTKSVAADVASAGITTVEARLLADIVRKFPSDGEVVFEQDGENTAIVKCGRSRFTLQTLSPDSFPDLKVGVFSHQFEMAGKDLAAAMSKVSFAISNEETRYYLNGIYIHTLDAENRLRMVATDGHRLARLELDCPAGAAGMPGIIVPRKTVGELIRLCEGFDGSVAIELTDTKIRLTAGDTIVLSKLIEGTFPDYERVTPKNHNLHALVERTGLEQALGRVEIIASEKGGKAVKLSMASGNLLLTVTNPDHGTATEEVPIDFDPEQPFEIGFNARYLGDCLGVLPAKEKVRFELGDAGTPTILRSESADSGLLLVLMPMRV